MDTEMGQRGWRSAGPPLVAAEDVLIALSAEEPKQGGLQKHSAQACFSGQGMCKIYVVRIHAELSRLGSRHDTLSHTFAAHLLHAFDPLSLGAPHDSPTTCIFCSISADNPPLPVAVCVVTEPSKHFTMMNAALCRTYTSEQAAQMPP